MVNNVMTDAERKQDLCKKFPKCFDGNGKLKDYQLHIPVDNDIEPVVQSLRRVPYGLREKLEKKIDELAELDIIEKVNTTMSLQTNNAQNFNSKELNDYLTDLNIEHRNTTPYWPQANGEVEIQNKSIMKRLHIAHVQKKNMRTELQTYLMMYRFTPHSTTGMSPAEMLFKRKIRTKIPDISDHRVSDHEIRDRDIERKGKGKIYGDNRRNARESDIKEGDLVENKSVQSEKNVLNENRVESGSNSNLENNQEAELTEIEQIENPVETEDVKSPTKTVAESYSQPSRVRKMPQKYSDFIMSNK
ncbi:uncharacterized protein LOC128215074 [Mya arenaria]|uniref:uncharacterized protein LOC128215074 n=1 Tax=Mya arenaria TaxID=6604 RepID=UPI0022E9738B|nr:uncharacterized protein LOC128215074 [Mya arenaria]